MKAKEYAEVYNKAKDNGRNATSEIGVAFLAELKAMVDKRNCRDRQTAKSILNELDAKWRAFCRITGDHKLDGFETLIKIPVPELWELWKSNMDDRNLSIFLHNKRKIQEYGGLHDQDN